MGSELHATGVFAAGAFRSKKARFVTAITATL
jgi:hypothetical protein